MRICVITYYCKVVVGPGAQLCTLLEVWVLGVGMSTLGTQTVCTPRIGGSKSEWTTLIVYKWLLKLIHSLRLERPPYKIYHKV